MKAMKAMKAKKVRKPAMKVSKIAKGSRSKVSVFLGGKEKTYTGLKKSDLMKNSKTGRIVTKKAHAAGMRAYKNIKGWTQAVSKAKKQLHLKGFVIIKKGSPVYKAAKAIYNA